MAAGRKSFISICCALQLVTTCIIAQSVPILERRISIAANEIMLAEVMNDIAHQGGFSFSFNPDIVDVQKQVSMAMKNKTVREILEYLFSPELEWKAKGQHVILKKRIVLESNSPSATTTISGYVTDGSSGEKMPSVSIYDKSSRASSVTNKYGFYELKVDKKTKAVELTINKTQFRDTLIYVRQTGNAIVNITIYPEQMEDPPIDSIALLEQRMREDQLSFINFILSEEQIANTKNVKDTLEKKFQFSFLPFVGSNLRLSGNTVNDYSLNVLGGYSMGSRKLEVAGLFNVDRDNVSNVQVAGLINAVGGRMDGIQAAGLVNADLHTTSGLQLAGLVNSNADTMQGIQAAGLINLNLKSVKGLSMAGLVNSTLGGMQGVHVAGLLNFSCRNAKGVQVAGLMNSCTAVLQGVQVAGLANIAKTVYGSQVGFINFSDSCSGVPVGFLSLVNKGYHTVEISADEVFPLNLSIRTGVRRFYNVLLAGMKVDNVDTPLWHFGYGLGTSISLGHNWWLNFDLTTQQLVNGRRFDEMNLLSKFHLMVDKSLTRKIAVAFGPVFNFYTSDIADPNFTDVFNGIPPYTFSDETYSNGLNIKTWLGGSLALRFF